MCYICVSPGVRHFPEVEYFNAFTSELLGSAGLILDPFIGILFEYLLSNKTAKGERDQT